MKNKKVRLSLLPDPFSSDNDSDQSDADRNDGDEQEEEEEDIMEMNDDDFNSTSSHDSSTLKTKTKTKHKTSKKSGKKKEKAAKVVSKFGSGYPGDPQTKKWLKDHFDPVFGYSELVRFSWKTAKVAMEESGVSVDW